jgi:hypothetical protein
MIFLGDTKGFSCPMVFMTTNEGIKRSECIAAKCAWWERMWRVTMQSTKTTKIWYEIDVANNGGVPEGAILIGGQCGASKGVSASKG